MQWPGVSVDHVSSRQGLEGLSSEILENYGALDVERTKQIERPVTKEIMG